jgi:hypothetical protein
MSHHLAQVNIARMRASLGDPSMAGLAQRIDEINTLAERSRGFVWRYRNAQDAADDLRIFSDYFVTFDEDRLFFNMSVWETLEDLKDYAFDTAHVELFKERQRWMAAFDRAHGALWWICAGEIPTVAEAKARLQSVHEHGPTHFAFTFAVPFPKPFVDASAR